MSAEAQAPACLLFELDHVGIAVRELDVARQRFSRLGFRLTRRSIHSGSRAPGGPVELVGVGQPHGDAAAGLS